jgi:hypothetical protein
MIQGYYYHLTQVCPESHLSKFISFSTQNLCEISSLSPLSQCRTQTFLVAGLCRTICQHSLYLALPPHQYFPFPDLVSAGRVHQADAKHQYLRVHFLQRLTSRLANHLECGQKPLEI